MKKPQTTIYLSIHPSILKCDLSIKMLKTDAVYDIIIKQTHHALDHPQLNTACISEDSLPSSSVIRIYSLSRSCFPGFKVAFVATECPCKTLPVLLKVYVVCNIQIL